MWPFLWKTLFEWLNLNAEKLAPHWESSNQKGKICLETEHSAENSSAARDMKCGGGEYCEQLVKYLLWFQDRGSGRMPLPTFGRPQPPAAARKEEFDCKYILHFSRTFCVVFLHGSYLHAGGSDNVTLALIWSSSQGKCVTWLICREYEEKEVQHLRTIYSA